MKKIKYLFATSLISTSILCSGNYNASAETALEKPMTFEEAKALEPELTREEWELINYDYAKEKAIEDAEIAAELKSGEADLESGFTPKAGDILYTNNAGWAKAGIPGHSAIYVGNGKIVEIEGYGHYPVTHDFKKFVDSKKAKKSDKLVVKVYRTNYSSYASKAAAYAKSLSGKKIPYGFSGSIKSPKKLYCSKLVWLSYYAGAGPKSVNWTDPEMMAPKFVDENIKGAKLVKTYY